MICANTCISTLCVFKIGGLIYTWVWIIWSEVWLKKTLVQCQWSFCTVGCRLMKKLTEDSSMFIKLYYTNYMFLLLYIHRIHGSVDCLSELSSSRLSHPFTGESSAVITSFDWDLFEICAFAFIMLQCCMQESVWKYLTLVTTAQGRSAAVPVHHRPLLPRRRRAEEVLSPGVPVFSTLHPPQVFRLHPKTLQQWQNQY